MNLRVPWRRVSLLAKTEPAETDQRKQPLRIGRSREILYLSLLGGVALLSSWFLSTVESSLHAPVQEHDNLPPLYMDNFLATHMDQQGIRQFTLTSPKLIQLPDPLGTWMERPSIQIFQGGTIRQWLIQAEEGWIASGQQTIKLKDAVTLTRSASSGKRPIRINTRDVFIYPSENIVETAAAAHLETPGGVLDAIGVKAYLNDDQLELLSKVRGTYEPATP